MKNYYRIMLGPKSIYAKECFEGNCIGAGFGIDQDLTHELPERWQDFNQKFRPIWMEKNPGKSKISAGLACGFLHTICNGIHEGDIVLCPDGEGAYHVGEVISPYFYSPNSSLPHQRKVKWFADKVMRESMSIALRNSSGSIGTVSNITKYADELEKLLSGAEVETLVSTDETVEDPTVFALEKHLEEFLVANWEKTALGEGYDIYSEDGEIAGQQYPSDTGPIDILAVSKDGKELLVVELKRGRASDAVVGQIQRYMGYVQAELAEDHQRVKGVIIALEDDLRLRRALAVTQGIEFYRYQVSFTLKKES
jgi:restriction system protein